MHVISRKALLEFWTKHPDAEQALRAWYREAKAATWTSPAEVRRRFAFASVLGAERVVFNIGGNKYRLVARINYAYATVYIRFVGTHAEYDAIDAESI